MGASKRFGYHKQKRTCFVVCCVFNKKAENLYLYCCALNVLNKKDATFLKLPAASWTCSMWANVGDCTETKCTWRLKTVNTA